jgi:hypothetical protein
MREVSAHAQNDNHSVAAEIFAIGIYFPNRPRMWRALDRIGSARHGSALLGSGERPCTALEPIGVRNQLHMKPFAWKQVLAFRMLRTFRTFCSVQYSGTVPIPAERVCAGPMQCTAFHFFSIEFYLCGLCHSEPCQSDPMCAQLKSHEL